MANIPSSPFPRLSRTPIGTLADRFAGWIVSCLFLLYTVSFPIHHTPIYVAIPVGAAAWFFGIKGGAIAGIVAFVLDIILRNIFPGGGFGIEERPSVFITGHILTLLWGIGLGWLRETLKKNAEIQAFYRAVVEDQTELICRFTHDGTLTFVNQAYSRYFNAQPEELLGRNWLSFLPEEERVTAKRRFEELTPEHPIVTYQHHAIMPGLGLRWQEWTDRVVFNDDGTPAYYQSVGRDITDRKRAEEALRESERRMREAQHIAELGNWEWNLQTGETSLSSEVYVMHGLGPDTPSFTSEALLKVVHPDDEEKVRAAISNAISEGKTVDLEYRTIRPDGATRVIHAIGVVTEIDAEGKPLIMVGTNQDITERNQTEHALRRLNQDLEKRVAERTREISDSEAKHRALVEQLPVVIYRDAVDDVGTSQYISPQIEALLGYPYESWTRDPFFWEKTVHPEDLERAVATIAQTLQSGRSQSEYRLMNRDGRVIWIRDVSTLIRDGNGQPQYVQGILQDITERKEAEEKLRESEERFRLIAQATVHAVWDWDLQSDQIWWGAGLSAMWHYPAGSISTEPEWRWSHLHPSDRDNVKESIQTAWRQNLTLWSKEYRFERDDGTYSIVFDRAYILYDPDGQPFRMLGAMMDISEQRQAEQELIDSERKFRTIYETVNDVIYETDYHGILTAISPSVEKYNGRSPLDLIGKPVWEMFVDPADYAALDSEVTQKGELKDYEIRCKGKNGEEIIGSFNAQVIFDQNGQPVGTRGIARDITERKQAEVILDRSNRVLSTLHTTAMALMRNLNLDDVLHAILQQAAELVNTPHGYLYLLSSDEDELEVKVATGIFEEYKGYRLKRNEGLAGKVWASGQPLVVTDYSTWGQRSQQFHRAKFHAIVGTPLTSNDKVIGVLGLSRMDPGMTFTNADVEFLSRFAYIASLALENARLHDLIQQELAARTKAQQALGESEERYRDLYENNPLMLFSVSTDGITMGVNDSAVRQLGYRKDELVGKSVLEVFHYADREEVEKTFRAFTQTPVQLAPWEFRKVTKSGETIWVSESARLIHDPMGIPLVIIVCEDITKRKEAEERLGRSEQRYRLLAENSNDVIWVRDINLNATYISPAVERMFGLSVQEAMRLSLDRILTPDSHSASLALWADMMTLAQHLSKEKIRGEYRNLELEIYKKDGSTLWTDTLMSFLLDEQGNINAILGVTRDISERRRVADELRRLNAELEQRVENRTQELRDANAYLNTVVNIATTLYNSLDMNDVLDHILIQAQSISPCRGRNIMLIDGGEAYIARRIGYMGMEDIERNLINIRFPLSWPTFKTMIDTGSTCHIPDTATNPNWRTLPTAEWVRSYIGIPLRVGGETVGFLNSSHDEPNFFNERGVSILETLAKYASIAIQNARLLETANLSLKETAALYEIARKMSLSLDPIELIGEVVQVLHSVFEYNQVQILLVDPTSGDLVGPPGSGLVAGELWMEEVRLPKGSGIAGNVAETGKPFFTNNVGEVIFHIQHPHWPHTQAEMAIPIKTGERILGVMKIELEPPHLIAEHDLQLAMTVADQLAIALQKAELYNELQASLDQEKAVRSQLVQSERLALVGRLLASVSHELNNPLQAIQNAIYLLQDERGISHQGRQDLQVILSETERMAGLIDRLRTSYRPTRREDFEPLLVNNIVEDVFALMETHLRHHNIAFVFQPDPQLPETTGLPDQIRQVLLNLFINAVESMPGGGQLTVSTSPTGEDEILISVSDTGTGIDPKLLPHIFDAFITSKDRGSGLGLTITYDIIHHHHGRIAAENNPDQGATFHIWLPIRAEAPA